MKSDGILVSIFRFVAFMFLFIVIVTISLLIYRSNEESIFQSQCNQIIARSGGLTKNAYVMCNTLSLDDYSIPTLGGNRAPLFWITTQTYKNHNGTLCLQLYDKNRINFGHKVRYTIFAQLPLFLQRGSNDPFLVANPNRNYHYEYTSGGDSNSSGIKSFVQNRLLPASSNSSFSKYFPERTPFGNDVSLNVDGHHHIHTRNTTSVEHRRDDAFNTGKDVGIQIKYDTGSVYSQVRNGSQTPGNYIPSAGDYY